MARPMKKGLAYFPLDTDFFQNRKIQRLARRYGCKGVTVYVALLCEMYGTNGYYLPYSDNLFFDIAFTLSLDEAEVKAVVDFGIELGLFDAGLKETRQILTSVGIQTRFLLVRKKGNACIPASLLLARKENPDGLTDASNRLDVGIMTTSEVPVPRRSKQTAPGDDVWVGKQPGCPEAYAGEVSAANGAFMALNAPSTASPAQKAEKNGPKEKGKKKEKKGKEKEKVKPQNQLKNEVRFIEEAADAARQRELLRMAEAATRHC